MTTIDGAPSIRVRAAGGFMMGAQNFDTVAEVQVLTTNYQAEYGRSSAGQLRMVTKSGTQSFRGNVFWSHQNDALDANTWTRNRSGLEKSPHNVQRLRVHAGRADLHPGRVQLQQAESVLLLGPGVAARPHRRRTDGHRSDRGAEERRLQRVLAQRSSTR